MNFNNYTIKAQEALQKATEIASGNGQQVVETGHLLQAIFQSDENLISFLLKKLGATKQALSNSLESLVLSYPKVSGGQPYLSNDAAKALQKAEEYLKDFGDEYIAVEHIILGLLSGSDKASQVLKDAGFQEGELIKAINELRGGDNVTDPNAESRYRSLERYSKNLNELAKKGENRSCNWSGRGDQACLANLGAKDKKQPNFVRRARRWKNSDCGRDGAADYRWRRSRKPEV